MWCVIPAAGQATRLGSLAGGRPKALLEIGDRTLIEHLLDRLSAPFSGVCVVTGEQDLAGMQSLLGARYRELDVCYSVQPEPAGVADAVRRAEGLVDGPFVTVMGDCYFESPISDFPLRWAETGSQGAVLVEPANDAGGQAMGLVSVSGSRITRIFKAAWSGETEWRVCGAFLLPETFFQEAAHTSRGPSGEHELEDVVSRMMGEGAVFEAIPYRGWRRNINTPRDLDAVTHRVTAAGTSPKGDGRERGA